MVIDPRQEASTPDILWQKINALWDFQIDVCASFTNRKCERYYDGAFQDALDDQYEWVNENHQRAFCNPPFGKMQPWIEKAIREYQKRPDAVVVVLGKNDPSTKWYRLAQEHCYVIDLAGKRVQFDPAPGIKFTQNNHCNSLFVFGGPPVSSFGKHFKTNKCNWYWSE